MPRAMAPILAKEILAMVMNAADAACRASQAFDALKLQAQETSQSMARVGEMYSALISTAQSDLPIDDGLAEAHAQVSRTDVSFSDLHRIFTDATKLMDQAVVQLAEAKSSWRRLQN
jgi:hypothetical protein